MDACGWFLEGDTERALQRLERLCRDGFGEACTAWGFALHELGTLELEPFRQACELDETAVHCQLLAVAALLQGGDESIEIALEATRRVCGEDLEACGYEVVEANPGRLLTLMASHTERNGLNRFWEPHLTVHEEKDRTERNRVLLLAEGGCELGDGLGCYLLANRIDSVEGGREATRKTSLLAKGCELLHGHSCLDAAKLAEEAGELRASEGFLATARRAFGAPCEGGERAACLSLGRLYVEGLGGPKDPEQATAILMPHCAEGLVDACDLLGVPHSLQADSGRMSMFLLATLYSVQGCYPGRDPDSFSKSCRYGGGTFSADEAEDRYRCTTEGVAFTASFGQFGPVHVQHDALDGTMECWWNDAPVEGNARIPRKVRALSTDGKAFSADYHTEGRVEAVRVAVPDVHGFAVRFDDQNTIEELLCLAPTGALLGAPWERQGWSDSLDLWNRGSRGVWSYPPAADVVPSLADCRSPLIMSFAEE